MEVLMEIEKQLLWIIAGGGVSSLEDGETIFYKGGLGKDGHMANSKKFCEKYMPCNPSSISYTGYAEYFCKNGLAVNFNSGKILNGKYHAVIYLPEQLTEKQIAFFEENKALFYEKYDSDIVGVGVYTSKPLEYNSSHKNFRDLNIESIIRGDNINNNLDLLYNEIEHQKEELYTK